MFEGTQTVVTKTGHSQYLIEHIVGAHKTMVQSNGIQAVISYLRSAFGEIPVPPFENLKSFGPPETKIDTGLGQLLASANERIEELEKTLKAERASRAGKASAAARKARKKK